jgi:uncharacterized membrane protein
VEDGELIAVGFILGAVFGFALGVGIVALAVFQSL